MLSEAIELVTELVSELTIAQATRHFNRSHLPNHSDQLKQHKVKAQATTARRSVITAEQQFRWNKTCESALSNLRRLNTGVCRLTRKSFGELIHHFITGGGETCFQACKQGKISVIGSTGGRNTRRRPATPDDPLRCIALDQWPETRVLRCSFSRASSREKAAPTSFFLTMAQYLGQLFLCHKMPL